MIKRSAENNSRDHTARRVRTSEHALRVALKAAKAEGMVVEKLCVSGGYIEIHIGDVEREPVAEKDEGLEEW